MKHPFLIALLFLIFVPVAPADDNRDLAQLLAAALESAKMVPVEPSAPEPSLFPTSMVPAKRTFLDRPVADIRFRERFRTLSVIEGGSEPVVVPRWRVNQMLRAIDSRYSYAPIYGIGLR